MPKTCVRDLTLSPRHSYWVVSRWEKREVWSQGEEQLSCGRERVLRMRQKTPRMTGDWVNEAKWNKKIVSYSETGRKSVLSFLPHPHKLELGYIRDAHHTASGFRNRKSDSHPEHVYILIEEAQIMSIEAIWIQKFKYSSLNRDHYVYESEL